MYNSFDISFIKNILSYINDNKSSILTVDFLIKYSDKYNKNLIKGFLNDNPRVISIKFYACDFEEFTKPIRETSSGYVIYSKKAINGQTHCGVISSDFFAINIKTFTESQKFNSCLNKKIAVDIKGTIKNCPSMPKGYGNIKNTSLREAIDKKEFKEYWNINKDQIDVCKDCEFRHICTDCRAYIENPDDIYSKPLKCGYNPYTNEWSEWSKNPLKDKAIAYYGLKGD